MLRKSTRLQTAVLLFEPTTQEHWDNNHGRNFESVCSISRVKTVPRGAGLSLGSPPLSPRSNPRGRSFSDGAVHRLHTRMGDNNHSLATTPYMFLPPQHRHPLLTTSPPHIGAKSTRPLQSTVDALTGSLTDFDVDSADCADLDTSPALSPASSPPLQRRRTRQHHHHHHTSSSSTTHRHRSPSSPGSAAAVHCRDDAFLSLMTMSMPNMDAPGSSAPQASPSAATHPFFLHRNAHEHDTFTLHGVRHRHRAHSLKGLGLDFSSQCDDTAADRAVGAAHVGHHGDGPAVVEVQQGAETSAGLQVQ